MVSPVREGGLVAHKYRVERVIGVGGMGVVVAAQHVELDERVALKFLKEEAAKKPELVERFLREARAATRIKSEHVVRVMDVGRLEDGLPFLVMEYLDGADLGETLARQGAMAVPDAVECVLHACEALAIAHAQGIVHRDIKPANLFKTSRPDGTTLVKLVDFGISKAALTGRLGEDVSLTRSQSVVGSPLYMSPEAMESARRIDARSDIWSLGVVLYELLSGQLAFSGESITRVCIAVLQEEPRSLRELDPAIPEGLERVVRRCLAKNPDERYQTVADFAEALLPYGPSRATVLVERARAVTTGRKTVGESDPQLSLDPGASALAVASRSKAETWGAASASPAPGTVRLTPLGMEGGSALPGGGTAVSAPPTEQALARSTSHPRAGRWRGPVLALVAVTMAFAAYVAARVSASTRPEPVSSAPVLNASDPSPPAAQFTLHIDSNPSGALVLDGERELGTTPLQMVLDPDVVGAQPKRLLLRKDGYLPYTVVQGTSEADVRQVIVLEAGPAAASAVVSGEASNLPPVATVRPASPGSKGPSKGAPAASPSRTAPQIRVER
jgi:serine/threonine-protein kinase